MMARNRNLLAQKTMEALSMITSDTWKPFVVESIVQRMANMLNYVLKLLVGARSRELKVPLSMIEVTTCTPLLCPFVFCRSKIPSN